MAPIIKVQYRVTHPNIDSATFEYKGPVITKWESHSNLLNVVRQMHNEFEIDPPVPEGHHALANQVSNASQVSAASEAPRIEMEEQKAFESAP